MSDPRDLEHILADWARSGVPLEHPDGARRERLVAGIARAVRERSAARARRRRRVAVLAVAASLALVAGFTGWRLRAAGPDASPAAAASVAEPSGAAHALAVGDAVRTEAAGSELRLVSGARVEIRPRSLVTLLDSGSRGELIELALGEIAVHVPKLAPPRTFAVRTPDARIVVHGTRFVVRVTEPGAGSPRTRVSVSEGTVSVHHAGTESFVSAGARWPAPPPVASDAASAPRDGGAAPAEVRDRRDPRPRGAASAGPPASALAPSASVALAEQNRLFAAARAARSRGDDRAAVGLLDQLLAKYPKGPLAPEARVERFRALERVGRHDEAAREAKKYLLENRDGFARDEARELVLPPKP